MKILSRRPLTARATTSSAPPLPYISAVSISVMPRSIPSLNAAASSAAWRRFSPMCQVPCPNAGTRWPLRPFQFEVAAANLGVGLAGLYAAFRSFEARLATNLALACFLIGAGIGYIRDIINAGNFAPGNAGPILLTDLLTATAIFVLL